MDDYFEIINNNHEQICIKSVLDTYKMEHEIREKLDSDAQGIVCRTSDSKIAIKFIIEDNNVVSRTKNPESFKKYDTAIRKLILKPFPEGIHVTFSMARLKDYAGYCMQFMDNMVPFKSLVSLKEFTITGGHRRRLSLLSKTAVQLAKLHAAGIVYCNISPQNVFISENPCQRNQDVWFINADSAFTPGEDKPCTSFTERYAAPELLAGSCCSQESDLYSFATMAFECLFCSHPFENSNDSLDNTEERIAQNAILDDEIFSLFQKVFSEGKMNPTVRPTALLWARALAHTEDKNVKCSKCGKSFTYKSGIDSCPWCQEKLLDKGKNVLVIRRDDKIVYARELIFSRGEKGGKFFIPERVFAPFDIDTNGRPILSIRTIYENGRGLEFKLEGDPCRDIILFSSSNETLQAYHILKLKKNTKFLIDYRNEKKKLHNQISIEVIEEMI